MVRRRSNSNNDKKCLAIVAFVAFVIVTLHSTSFSAKNTAVHVEGFVVVLDSSSFRLASSIISIPTRTTTTTTTRQKSLVFSSSLFSPPFLGRQHAIAAAVARAPPSGDETTNDTTRQAVVQQHDNDENDYLQQQQGNGRDDKQQQQQAAFNRAQHCLALQQAASKFKILTCSSTSCAAQRSDCGLDEYSTFSAMYVRAQAAQAASQQVSDEDNVNIPFSVAVEESPCLGACQYGPCVAIEHEDYIGTVALEGMTASEFSDRVYHHVVTEQDANAIWNSVVQAVHVMAHENNDNDTSNDSVNETTSASSNYV